MPRASPASIARGVRRSWLAQATSSRRASKSCSRFAAISLNDRAELGELGRPGFGRTCGQVAGRERAPRRPQTRSSGPRSSGREAAPRAERRGADAAATARIFTSSPMWNITQPESRTAASGTPTASSRRPDELQAHGRAASADARATTRPTREASRARRRARRRSWREPVADAPDGLQGPRLRRVVLDLLAQPPDMDGDRAGVERGRVAPDASHELVAREDPARMAGEEPEQVELLRRQAQLPSAAARPRASSTSIDEAAELEPLRVPGRRGRRGGAPRARGRPARAARRASSRSRRRRARARRSGRPPRRAP